VSSTASINSTECAQPSALRRFTSAPRTTTSPAVAPVTVFRDGVEAAMYDGGASANASKSSSINNLQNVGMGVGVAISGANKNSGPPQTTVAALVGAVGTVVGPTAGFGTSVSSSSIKVPEGVGQTSRSEDSSFLEAEDDFDDSASDETLSDSSDDDVVMLHSKLPAGAARGRPVPEAKDRNSKRAVDFKKRTRPSTTTRESKPDPHLPPPATLDSAGACDENMLNPDDSNPLINVVAPIASGKSDPNLPQLSALNLQSKAPDRSNNMRQPPRDQDAQNEDARKRRSADQTLLLPGFKIAADRSSDAESSPAGTSLTGTEQKGETTSSVYRPGVFGDDGSGKIANGVNAGGMTGNTEVVTQALRQLRMGNLTRDFWMKDEVCKDCFLCGARFTAWRRKHHCRAFSQSSVFAKVEFAYAYHLQGSAAKYSVRSAQLLSPAISLVTQALCACVARVWRLSMTIMTSRIPTIFLRQLCFAGLLWKALKWHLKGKCHRHRLALGCQTILVPVKLL
jgi:1-phosphatidylinositol-3-phosphate 5-kinase